MRPAALPRHALVALALPLAASTAGAASPPDCRGASPDELERQELRIGRIDIRAGDIFDPGKPGEGFALFRLANRLHRVTRPEVIRRMLLVAPGDKFSAARVAESERILRRHRYFFDAKIVVDGCRGGELDLAVETRDVWSLDAGFHFRRSGGTNTVHVDVQDKNFLGTGKELAARWESNVDRDTVLLRYQDDRLFGSHLNLEVEGADSSDGQSALFVLERPFFSLDTPWAAGVRVVSDDRIDSLYDLGEVSDRFRHAVETGDAWVGWSSGRRQGSTHRFETGVAWEDHRFTAVGATSGPGRATAVLPPNRTLAYPWVSWEWTEDGFVVESDLDKIRRSEDLNLGRQAGARLGRSLRSLGATEDAWLASVHWGRGVRIGSHQLLLLGASLSGRLESGTASNVVGSFSLRDLVTDFRRHRLVLGLFLDATRRADPETQLLLGGDSGLRGYPLRYQAGDRRALLSVEQRFYGERELFHLVHLGAAVFADGGRAWSDEPGHPDDLGWLADLGVGLRVSSSRSARAAMVHLDLAAPLAGPRDLAHLQWLVTTTDRF